MKNILLYLDDEEYEALEAKKKKSKLSWKDYFLMLAKIRSKS